VLALYTNNTERVRVTATGNVGIGTASPTERLQVSDGNVAITNTDNTARQLRLYEPSGSGTNFTAFRAQAQASDIIYTLPASLTPTSAVGAGILQTDASGNLSWLNPTALVTGSAWALTGNSGTNPAVNFLGTTDAQPLVIRTNNTERMRVTASGDVGIGTTTPLEAVEVVREGVSPAYVSTSYANANFAGAFVGRRARGTMSAPAAVQSGDGLVFVGARGYDGTAFTSASRAFIRMDASENWTATAQGTRIVFATTANGTTSTAERVVIQSSGDVEVKGGNVLLQNSDNTARQLRLYEPSGAGTNFTAFRAQAQASDIIYTLPASLTPTSTVAAGILQTDASGNLSWLDPAALAAATAWALTGNSITGTEFLGTTNNQPLVIRTNNVERLRVTATGNVGIGTAAPTERLQVSDGNVAITNTDNTARQLRLYEPSGAGTNFTALRAQAQASDITYTLPADLTTTNTVATGILQTDASGNLSWLSPAALAAATAWALTGNSITGTEFLGTTNNQPLVIRTNNTERVRVTATGNVGIGTASPTERLQVSDGNVAITNTDNTARQLRLYEPSGSGTNFTAFRAQAQASDIIYTLPASLTPTSAVGAGILQTDASGNLSWLNPTALVTGSAWALTGNSGTNPAVNFLGTADAQPLVIRTNNTERVRVTATGNVGIGTAAPTERLQVSDGNVAITNTDNTARQLRLYEPSGAGTNFTAFRAQAQASDIIYTLPASLTPTSAVGAGILQTDASGNLSWLNPTALVTGSAWALTGNSGTNPAVNFLGTADAQPLVIRTNNTERVRVTATGNVGIGTAAPTERLQVSDGNVAITNTDNTARQLRLYEPSGAGANFTAFQAQAQASDIIYTLPASLTAGTLASGGRILQSDGGGNLSWLDPAALAAATAWALTGNSITSAWNGSSGNFLGTTNAQPLVIATTNTTTPQPIQIWVGNQETFRFNPPGTSAPAWSIQRGGGNQRGLHAVDLQSARSAATQVASGNYSVIGGGQDNTASGAAATVGGGFTNTAGGNTATVGGGALNTASGDLATIGGGAQNQAIGSYAAVGGGYQNIASGQYATVGGGQENTASGFFATVGGGVDNTASGNTATVGGGWLNTASGVAATVGGGSSNTASGDYSAIPGGFYLRVGERSFGFSGQTSATPTDLSANSNIAAFVDVDLWLYSRDRTQASQLRFYEAQAHGSGANYVALRAPNTLSANTTYTLPASLTAGTLASGGRILQSDGGGNLSWLDPAALAAATAWALTGNSITSAWNGTTGSFLGTTNAQPLVIATTNTTTPQPIQVWVGNQETFRFNPPGASAPAWSIQRGGGNQRGLHAVDLQSARSAATQVASGDYSVIGGGTDNTASGGYATVGGGRSNTANNAYATVGGGYINAANSPFATVGGGQGNTASGNFATVGGGIANTASGNFATVGGGYSNTASGDYSAIPGGAFLQVGTRSFGFSGQTTETPTDLSANSNIAAFVDVDLWLYSRDFTSASQLRLYEAQAHSNGAEYVAFQAPNTLTTSTTYTLPADLTTTNTVATGILQTDASGNLSWLSPAALAAATAWALTGNSITGTEFLGTTNNQPLVIRTNNTERVRVTATGNVGIGTASPTERLQVSDGNVAITNTDNTARQLRLYEPSGSGTNFTAFRAQAQASDIIYTLPASLTPTSAVGAGILQTDASGNLSWLNPTALVTGSAWALTGNSGTNPAVNFLGTADAQPLVIRTNNTERVRVTATGNVGIGTAAPTERLQVSDGNVAITNTDNTARQLRLYEPSGSGTNFTAFRAQAQASDIIYTLPASLTPTSAVGAGILQTDASGNLSWLSPAALTAATAWALTGNSITGTEFLGTTNAQPLVIRTNNTEQMRITATGNVGIGTAAPTERLQVSDGNVAITNTDNTARQLRLYEPSGSGTNFTAFRAQAQASDITYTLPASLTPTSAVGAGILQTDASGNLSWLSPTALAAATAWALTGNSITSAWNGSSGNFLGTTNAQPLVIATTDTTTPQPIQIWVGNQETFRFNPPGSSAPAWSIQRGGGNQRGLHAVDLQSARSVATQVASGDYSVIGGGARNTASGHTATVGGGNQNTASGIVATVCGGWENTASGYIATVGGGRGNTANGYIATVGGGRGNTASGAFATVGGGENNIASYWYTTVGGGTADTASGFAATVGGGRENTASGDYATVGGGYQNTASGVYSAIPGGSYLRVGARSFGFSGQTSAAQTDLSADTNIAAFVDVDMWLYSRDRTQASQLRFYEAQAHSSGANYVALRAPTGLSANTTYTLPASAPATSAAWLQSDNTGAMSWRPVLYGTVSVNRPAIGANTSTTFTVTITGVQTGDLVFLTPPSDIEPGLVFQGASVTAANTVTIRMRNVTGTAIAASTRTWSYMVIRP
jgi:hypothetical protein